MADSDNLSDVCVLNKAMMRIAFNPRHPKLGKAVNIAITKDLSRILSIISGVLDSYVFGSTVVPGQILLPGSRLQPLAAVTLSPKIESSIVLAALRQQLSAIIEFLKLTRCPS